MAAQPQPQPQAGDGGNAAITVAFFLWKLFIAIVLLLLLGGASYLLYRVILVLWPILSTLQISVIC